MCGHLYLLLLFYLVLFYCLIFQCLFLLSYPIEQSYPSSFLLIPNFFSGLKTAYFFFTAAAAKSLHSCLTLCDPTGGSPPGSPVPGILQARTLEWVAISFSNAWKWKVKVKSLSRVRLLATPWTAAHQAPLSMGFSRQEYWSGVPLPSKRCHSSIWALFYQPEKLALSPPA